MNGKIVTVTLNPSIDKSILIDKLVPYGLNRVSHSRTDPGGKGINVARVLKNFGADVTVLGLIAGSQGKLLADYLKQMEIKTDFLEIDGETRTNLKILDNSVNRITEINETGFYVTPDDLNRFRKKYKIYAEQADVIVLSGSIPPGIPQNFYAECISIAKNGGKKVILDADGAALQEGLKAIPFAVKPNTQEFESLVGQKFSNQVEMIRAVKKLIQTGVETVIISMGPDGAIVSDSSKIYHVNSWDIEVKNATGAGDSMVAALAYSVLKKDSLYDIAKITTAAGTITASMAGTQICELDDVLKSLHCVTVSRI